MQLIGHLEIKLQDKTGKISMAIPFRNKTEFYTSENKTKNKENSPDFLIWNSGIKIGYLWKNKYLKDEIEKNYLSGNIFAPSFGLEDNKMKLVIFEDEKQNKGIWSGLVFWDFNNKEVDRKMEEIQDLNNEETDNTIF